jgi:hypothetical protein
VVTLNYDVVQRDEDGEIVSTDPVQDLTSPDGGELDLNQITSSYVLQTALEGLTLSQPLALADLRDNIRIDRILTEDSRRQQEVASRMMDDKSAAAYAQVQSIDLTYINSFVVSLANGFGLKAYELTDAELEEYDRLFSSQRSRFIDYRRLLRIKPRKRGPFGNAAEYLLALAKGLAGSLSGGGTKGGGPDIKERGAGDA